MNKGVLTMAEAFIYDAVRTPRGKGKTDGSLHEITPLSLASQVMSAIPERLNIDKGEVEDVAFGCVSPVGEQGAVITRSAVLRVWIGSFKHRGSKSHVRRMSNGDGWRC
jgi:acetyl-CoA acetyltransferase